MKKEVNYMRFEIEKRLHRVQIKIGKTNIRCPYSEICSGAENSYRCNSFYQKCTKFKGFK